METRTARVRIELPNPDGDLAARHVRRRRDRDRQRTTPWCRCRTAPSSTPATRQVVLLDKGEGRFEPRAVKVGRRGDGYVEIREGVADGDRVVTSANFLIDAESNLKAALQGMAAGQHAGAAEEKPP